MTYPADAEDETTPTQISQVDSESGSYHLPPPDRPEQEWCGVVSLFFRLSASSLIPILQPYNPGPSFKWPTLPPPPRPFYPAFSLMARRDGEASHPLDLANSHPGLQTSPVARECQRSPVTLPRLADILGSHHPREMERLLIDLHPRFDFPPEVIEGNSRPQIREPRPSALGSGCPSYNGSIRRRSSWIRTPERDLARPSQFKTSLDNEPAPRNLPQPVCLFHFQPIRQRLKGCPPWQRPHGSFWGETIVSSRKRARHDEDLPEVDERHTKVIRLPNHKCFKLLTLIRLLAHAAFFGKIFQWCHPLGTALLPYGT